MRFNYSPLFFALLAFALSPKLVSGQGIQTLLGCDEFPPLDEVVECAICNDDPFLGTAAPFTPSNHFVWCGTIENDQFIGFHSDPTGNLIFEVEVLSTSQGQGIQIGVEDEDRNLWFCIDEITPFQGPTTYQFQVPPSTNFFLRIDGFNGDECDFLFTPIQGFRRRPAIVRVTNTSGQTQVDYLFNECSLPPSTTDTIDGCVYEISYEFIPDTSGTVQVSLLPNNFREVFTWADSIPLRARVEKVLTLIEEPANSSCDSFFRFPYLSHFLDLDVYGGLSQNEFWECGDDRIAYELEQESTLEFNLFEGGAQRYVLEAAGLHRRIPGETIGRYFRYSVFQNGQFLTSGALTVDNFRDTLSFDFSLGIVTVRMINPFSTPLEYALTRLDSVTPWIPEYACTPNSLQVCLGEELVTSCNLLNQPCFDSTDCFQSIIEIRNTQLFEQGTSTVLNAELNPTLNLANGDLSINLAQQTISNLGEGSYTARLILGIDQTFGGFCAEADSTTIDINFEVVSARDTIVLDTLNLVPGEEIIIFQISPINDPQTVSAPGNYFAIASCTLYVQPVFSPATIIQLDSLQVCGNECAYTPTGELITCTPGPFVFTAANDTTYIGELVIDNAQPLNITDIDYICDSLSTDWYIALAWSGSYGPYTLDGQLYNDSSGRAGPFQDGQTIDISLTGASPCVDTIFINGSYSCLSNTQSIQQLGFQITPISSSVLEVTAPSYGWQLRIIDILGREVLTTTLQRDANQLFVGDLLPGTYFLVAQNGSQRASNKWVKR